MMQTKQCGSCGGKRMERDVRDAPYEHKGEQLVVCAVDGWFCPDCDAVEFATREAATRYSATVRAQMDAVDAKERAALRATRKRLGLKQAEAAALFGGGINAFSEYERGIRQPSKSTVLLLKLLDRHPELLAEIRMAA